MTEEKEAESGELVAIKEVDIPALFKADGCNPIIEGLKKKAAEFEGDISTAKGRKAIASFAAKFSTVKTKMDGFGKALSDEYRAKIAPINEERNKIKACCDESRDKVRKPLTEWEDAEKERVAKHEEAIQLINDTLEHPIEDSNHALRVIEYLKGIIVDEAFEEFELAATKAKEAALTQLEAKFIVLEHAEKEKVEADRLEKERLAKEQEEREAKIAEDAAEAARIETEEKAKAEAEKKEQEEKEKREKLEKETLQAQLDKEKAERETKEAEALAEKEKKEAAEQAEEEKKAAIEEERKKVADQAKADEEAEEKRQSNLKHRNKIHREAKASLMALGIYDKDAAAFVTMVKDGLVKHMKIDY